MANKILGFGTSATNELTDAAYAADAQRLSGNVPGVARSSLVNKVLHQASIMAAGLAQFIADRQPADIVDTLSPTDISNFLKTTLPSPVAGQVLNLRASQATAAATINYTADELVVKNVLGGAAYTLSNFAKTLNLATVGAGGMDTGTAAANSYVAIYAIYNPTTGVSALLGQTAAVARPEIYGGANMPAGFTHSALIGVWPTTAGTLLKVGIQNGRLFSFSPVTILSITAVVTSFTSLSIATSVPPNAKFISGTNSAAYTTNAGTSLQSTLASDVTGIGARNIQVGGAANTVNTIAGQFVNLPIITPQTIWYIFNAAGGVSPGLTTQIVEYIF